MFWVCPSLTPFFLPHMALKVLTRKQPYAGLNFMGVSLDVLEGRRPMIPSDCPSGMAPSHADQPQAATAVFF